MARASYVPTAVKDLLRTQAVRLPLNRFTPSSPLFPNTFTSILAFISYVWSTGTASQVVSLTLAFNPPNLPKLCNQLIFPNTSFIPIPTSSLLGCPAGTSKSTSSKLKISHHFCTQNRARSQFPHLRDGNTSSVVPKLQNFWVLFDPCPFFTLLCNVMKAFLQSDIESTLPC